MKVAVVGLLPQQANIIASEFPRLDLRFLNKNEKHGREDFWQNTDRIMVMTKFVSHALYDKLDRGKTVHIHGGLTRLRHALSTLNIIDKFDRLPVAIDETGFIHEDHDMVDKLDFTVLKTAKPGDLFEFSRPPKQTIDKFDQQIQQARSYYKRIHNVLTTVERKDDKAFILVTQVGEAAPEASKPIVVNEPIQDARPTGDPSHQQFWRDAFLQHMLVTHGLNIPASIEAANQALAAYRGV